MGNSNSCTQRDHIDPKPEIPSHVGVTIAGSQGCQSCSLVLTQTSTTSVVSVTREGGTLLLEPSVPLSVSFNGTNAVFTKLYLYTPSPLSVEQTQADAVIQCMSDKIWMFIPLMKSDSGSSVDFLTTIAGSLDPGTSEGLGIVDPKTGQYATLSVATGQEWSITSLVKGTDPYFTWVNGKLQQYTKSETPCDRYIGWKSLSGPQVIFFQNPIAVSSSDIDKIRETIGTVMPSKIGLSVSAPLYSPGEAHCPPKPPKLKLPTFKMGKYTDFVVYFGTLLTAFLAIVLAVTLINQQNGPLQYIARGIAKAFEWKPKPPTPL